MPVAGVTPPGVGKGILGGRRQLSSTNALCLQTYNLLAASWKAATVRADEPLARFRMAELQGRIIAEDADCFRSVDQDRGFLGALSHTASLVEKQTVKLVQLPGKRQFQLHVTLPSGEVQALQLDEEWELMPADVEQIGAMVHTQKQEGESNVDVALNGEFEGEDLPLFDIEMKKKSHFLERLLSPNTSLAVDGQERPASEPRKLIIGWEDKATAMEWYALVAMCLGRMKADHPSLQQLPMARSRSQTLLAGATAPAEAAAV
ncbi:MAG: hypothetical protein J3K34DRAFT_415027 [Monoraphidium minutum]|nr:MAG: hypothetical protein J3K34DRAFT_415027 [Monoraphidium minutum]